MPALESIATINSMIRTLLVLAVVGGAGMVGWETYQSMHERQDEQEELRETRTRLKDTNEQLDSTQRELETAQANLTQRTEEISGLNDELKEQELRYRRLDTAMRLLKVDRRAARLTVVKQEQDADSGAVISEIEFVEIDDRGEEVAETKRQFLIQGDLIYIDSWVVKFEDKYVEQSDLHRSTSLVMFKRIFGEKQEWLPASTDARNNPTTWNPRYSATSGKLPMTQKNSGPWEFVRRTEPPTTSRLNRINRTVWKSVHREMSPSFLKRHRSRTILPRARLRGRVAMQ